MIKPSPSSIKKSAPPRFDRLDLTNARLLLRSSKQAYDCANAQLAKILQARSRSDVTILDKVLFQLSCRLSTKALANYSTLHTGHIDDIHSVIAKIKQYLDDNSQRRPLNFLMLASPGAGKSHFVKCIADSLHSSNITYDMTALEKSDDLIPTIEAARNQKVIDKIPLLFLDEFDSRPENIPILLPLLWSGEIILGQHDLKLGKVVVILAGSDAKLPEAMEQAKSMQRNLNFGPGVSPKIVDLLSRINGGTIVIPPFLDANHKIDRRADKVCAGIHLLSQRFEALRRVPIGLIQVIYDTEFRFGVRSINHLIDSIPYKKNAKQLRYSDLALPMNSVSELADSSLSYHLIDDKQGAAIVRSWQAASSVDDWLRVFREDDEYFPYWIPADDASMDDDVIRHYYERMESLD